MKGTLRDSLIGAVLGTAVAVGIEPFISSKDHEIKTLESHGRTGRYHQHYRVDQNPMLLFSVLGLTTGFVWRIARNNWQR